MHKTVDRALLKIRLTFAEEAVGPYVTTHCGLPSEEFMVRPSVGLLLVTEFVSLALWDPLNLSDLVDGPFFVHTQNHMSAKWWNQAFTKYTGAAFSTGPPALLCLLYLSPQLAAFPGATGKSCSHSLTEIPQRREYCVNHCKICFWKSALVWDSYYSKL